MIALLLMLGALVVRDIDAREVVHFGKLPSQAGPDILY